MLPTASRSAAAPIVIALRVIALGALSLAHEAAPCRLEKLEADGAATWRLMVTTLFQCGPSPTGARFDIVSVETGCCLMFFRRFELDEALCQ